MQLGYGEEGIEGVPGEIYDSHGEKNSGIVIVEELTPIQMPNLDLNEVFEGRKQFSKEEWINLFFGL